MASDRPFRVGDVVAFAPHYYLYAHFGGLEYIIDEVIGFPRRDKKYGDYLLTREGWHVQGAREFCRHADLVLIRFATQPKQKPERKKRVKVTSPDSDPADVGSPIQLSLF